MRTIIISIALALLSTQATAATCLEQANEKKLRSHAQEYFMKRCEEEAKKNCESLAQKKKLEGTEKRAFVMKCVADAVGS